MLCRLLPYREQKFVVVVISSLHHTGVQFHYGRITVYHSDVQYTSRLYLKWKQSHLNSLTHTLALRLQSLPLGQLFESQSTFHAFLMDYTAVKSRKAWVKNTSVEHALGRTYLQPAVFMTMWCVFLE